MSELRVLVTAGGTREPIDSVRYIGNRSSGRMGFALAAEAARRGASVTVIAANVALEPPPGVRVLTVETAAAARRRLRAGVRALRRAADGRRRRRLPAGEPGGLEAEEDRAGRPPAIELEPTADVLSGLAAAAPARPGDRRIRRRARRRTRSTTRAASSSGRAWTRLSSMTYRTLGSGSRSSENEVTILTADGSERHVPRTSKEHVARAVLDEVRAAADNMEGGSGWSHPNRRG